ncbi:MAG: hypothetical protein ACR652_21820 [Methylocystis sp.]|uniref:hypothetical protein n=1 Tax=Methylocystis sp. TaxID=1911079 RepID=UPI003DA507D4
MIIIYVIAAAIMAIGSLYFALRSQDFCKFLSGAFFCFVGRFALPLSCKCFRPPAGHGFYRNTKVKRGPLRRPVRTFHDLYLLRFPQGAQKLNEKVYSG